MKYIFNILILGLICLAGYLLYLSIQEPIEFAEVKTTRSNAVSSKLIDIRTSQEMYRSITGSYAGSFDLLKNVLQNDSIPFVSIIGDPDDPTNMDKVIRTTTYESAKDSINALGIDLDDMKFIPFTDGKVFDIQADTIEYQSTSVNVVQVSTRWKDFMGDFGDIKFQKYDQNYDPNKIFKFGDMNTPSISGNWE